MYPLISGIVLGGKQRLSTARALLLTFIYVQGMALTYTALGLVVAAAGLQSPGGATAPIRAHWPRHRLYLAGDVNVWLVYSTTPLFAANTSHVDEQSPTGRLTWRCVCYGGDCLERIRSPMHITPVPLARFCCISPKAGTCGRAVTLYLYALGMGLPLMLITVFA